MKKFYYILTLFCFYSAELIAQTEAKIENAIIITIDGLRWQEVFNGMDSLIAINPNFNQKDSIGIFKKYWSPKVIERRKKLFPFLWNSIAINGQIYGNRTLNTNVNTSNPYWFSYPGYSEIFCGFVDTSINSNHYPKNPNTNFLEFINKQEGFKGKVAAFCAWDAFDRILNKERGGFPVICGNDSCGGSNPDAEQRTINILKQNTYTPFDEEALDAFTHYAAIDYLKKKAPRVLYISYGETDEWAHAARYKDYLDAANKVDKWVGDIWNFIQNDPHYKNKTLLFITVDHGRGEADKWTSHNSKIIGANEIWFAVMGPEIIAKGEINSKIQFYQEQFAQTITQLLGLTFKCEHTVSKGFAEIFIR